MARTGELTMKIERMKLPHRELIPTPVARDHKGQDLPNRTGRSSLGHLAATGKLSTMLIPTPGGALVISRTPLDRDELIPTSTATDAKASGVTGNWNKEKAQATSGRHSGTTLTDYAVRAGSDGQRSSGGMRLSPRFVEWMMALPDGWAAIDGAASEWADQIHALGNSVVDVGAAFGLGVLLTRIADDDPEAEPR